ncbi:hypothetical protein TNCV_4362621 [Trichonephila clavipes]|nr:hypothetical protein TNCV_4362621 [Trichonephila clavipes]
MLKLGNTRPLQAQQHWIHKRVTKLHSAVNTPRSPNKGKSVPVVCKTRHGAYLEYTQNIVIQHQGDEPTGLQAEEGYVIKVGLGSECKHLLHTMDCESGVSKRGGTGGIVLQIRDIIRQFTHGNTKFATLTLMHLLSFGIPSRQLETLRCNYQPIDRSGLTPAALIYREARGQKERNGYQHNTIFRLTGRRTANMRSWQPATRS